MRGFRIADPGRRAIRRRTIHRVVRVSGDTGLLHFRANAGTGRRTAIPADAVSLRSVSSDNFVVVDITGESKIIGEVSYTAALTTLHEKAIYLHEAKQFHVERFDFKERKAYVKRVDSDYYTDAIDYTQVKSLREFEKAEVANGVESVHGDVQREQADRRVQENQVLHE